MTQEAAKIAGVPAIAVSRAQGKFLSLAVLRMQATRILKAGAPAGYSAIWTALALLAQGRLVTPEIDRTQAEIARANTENPRLDNVVDVRQGAALEILAKLEVPSFELCFIDADKEKAPPVLSTLTGCRGKARSSLSTTWCAMAR